MKWTCKRAWSCRRYPHGDETKCYGLIEQQEELKRKGQLLPRCAKKRDCYLPEGHHKDEAFKLCFTIAETDARWFKAQEG